MTRAPDVVVIGAGPSGLAVGGSLRQRGVAFEVLERADAVGSTWRNHYERLHLHTAKQHSALPGLAWPEYVPTYPSREEVVAYLEAYAARFEVRPRFGESVARVRREAGRWVVEHTSGVTRARAVVVATGYNRVPTRPSWPGQERFAGAVIHSSEYRNGRAWRGRRALVVGAGNSGAEIALDLWESGAADVSLGIRGPLHVVPRDVLGVPAQVNSLKVVSRLPLAVADRMALAVSQYAFGDLSAWGIRRPSVGPVTQVVTQKKIPLIDVGTITLVKQGHIRVVPGVARFTATGAVFDDGRELPLDVVVLATGYRTGIEAFLDARDGGVGVLDAKGYPTRFGTEAPVGGLWFVGYRNPLTGALHDIAREAENVAREIARAAGRAPAT